MPRSARIRSAVGVVGSFAPSTTTRQSTLRALVSRVITPPSAAGTSHSHGIVHRAALVIASPPGNSETGRRAALWASSGDVEPPLVRDPAVHIRDGDDPGAGFRGEQPREVTADVTEPLDHDAAPLERDPEVPGVLRHHVHHAPAGRLLAPERPAE